MSKYIDADKLIASLERQNVDKRVIEPVIRIINSLQQEQPEKPVPNDLEEAAWKYKRTHTYEVVDYDGYHNGNTKEVYDVTPGESFIAGAKWQAEQDQKTIELAEDHAYLAGAVNEREKMMKEAVETEVTETCGIASVWIKTKQFKPGQKVRIIIVKEEGEMKRAVPKDCPLRQLIMIWGTDAWRHKA